MQKIKAYLIAGNISSNSSEAHTLYKKSSFGEPLGEKIQYSLSETLFLVEKNQMEVYSNNKLILFEDLFKKLTRQDRKIQTKYLVFKDLREKGYVIKTALKFGAEFRVYDKGTKPGKKHARWLVFTDKETTKLTWNEFSSKNRVAHSTKKNLLLAIVDEEGDITYYEVKWLRP